MLAKFTLSAALTELKSRPPRSAFTRLYGSETGTRIVWAGTRFEMENALGKETTWYLTADDVLGEWVVLDAPCLPEFVAGGLDLPHFPAMFMAPIVNRLLDVGFDVVLHGVSDGLDTHARLEVGKWCVYQFTHHTVAAAVVPLQVWNDFTPDQQRELRTQHARVLVVRPQP